MGTPEPAHGAGAQVLTGGNLGRWCCADEGRTGARRRWRAGRRVAHRRPARPRRETGWDPGSADYIVGTSAGSMIGALRRAGVPPWFMVAHSAGETFDGLTGADGRPAAEADRAGGRRLPAAPRAAADRARARWQHGAATWRARLRHTPLAAGRRLAAGGVISTEPLKDTSAARCPRGWADHPNFWVVAMRLRDRASASPSAAPTRRAAELADAVAASCAIPGFYRPVRIGGRRYVDGGVCSTSNLDMLAGRGPRPGDLPQPDLLAPPPRAWHRSTGRAADPRRRRAGGWAARRGRCAPAAPRWCSSSPRPRTSR